jgi:hypothetical protein
MRHLGEKEKHEKVEPNQLTGGSQSPPTSSTTMFPAQPGCINYMYPVSCKLCTYYTVHESHTPYTSQRWQLTRFLVHFPVKWLLITPDIAMVIL